MRATGSPDGRKARNRGSVGNSDGDGLPGVCGTASLPGGCDQAPGGDLLAALYPWARYFLIIMATGFWLAVFVIAMGCGGGGPTASAATGSPAPTPPAFIDYRDFAPYRTTRTGIWNGGQWVSTVIDANTIDVLWSPTVEEHRIRTVAGELWVMLDAYRDTDTGNRYASIAARAEIDRGDGRGWQALPVAGLESSLYAPAAWDGRAIVIRQWGCIRNDPKYGGACEKKWFHVHRLELIRQVTNSCWTGDQFNTRDVIQQKEAWWDSGAGWNDRGHGAMGSDGLPTGEGITFLWWQEIAKGAGFLWRSSAGDCLVR